MDLNPRGTPAPRGNHGKSSLLPRNSFRGGPPNNFCPPPLHVNSQGPPIPVRGPRDPSLAGGPPMLGPPGNLDSVPGRTNFGRGDHLSMGIPERGPLRSRDFAPSPPREMRRDYRNEREFREYSPREFDRPSFREKMSSRDYLSSDRDIGSSRSSRDYISPRYDDLDREYSSREFMSRDHTPSSRGSRSYSTSRDAGRSFSSHDYERGGLSPREYDSYRSYVNSTGCLHLQMAYCRNTLKYNKTKVVAAVG